MKISGMRRPAAVQARTSHQSGRGRVSVRRIVVFLVVFAITGTALLYFVRAATASRAVEAESGVLGTNAQSVQDTTASSGKAVRFKAASSLVKAVSSYTEKSNISYGQYGNANLLDLYIPNGSGGPYPTIVYVHGGAWIEGDKSDCTAVSMNFVKKGFAVACINYRLADGTAAMTFPAQIIDVKASIRFLRAHAADYGLYANKMAVWGDSAGGHLAAMAGTANDVAAFDVGQNLSQSSTVQVTIDFCGPTDLILEVQTYPQWEQPDAPETELLGGQVLLNKAKAEVANPLNYIDSKDGPFLIYHGTADDVVPTNQSQVLYDALQKAGVSAKLTWLQGAGHDGSEFRTTAIGNEIASFLDQILR